MLVADHRVQRVVLGSVVARIPCLVCAELVHHARCSDLPGALVGDERVRHQREAKVLGIPAGVLRTLLHQRDGVADVVEVVGVRDVAVAQFAGSTQGGIDVAAEQDRWPACPRGRRRHSNAVEGEHLAPVGEALPGPRTSEYGHGLDRARQPLPHRDTEHPELLGSPPDTEAERQASAGELIDHRGILREAQRVMERREDHSGAQRDRGRRRRERGTHHQERGQVAVGCAVVLTQPGGVESHRLREAHELDRVTVLLGEGAFRSGRDLAREQPDADAHRHERTLPPGRRHELVDDGPPPHVRWTS